jgi:probable selenium-dependent hydroxylase accessory protein YqeC
LKHTGLAEALELGHDEVISLVGGGGKTSLMFALARELAAGGRTVISTTTTKILPPSLEDSPRLIVEKDWSRLASRAAEDVRCYRHVTIVSENLPSGKLKGISPETVVLLAKSKVASFIIVEADGSAQRPLKAPNATEPVIPENTTLVVPIVGIDALNCLLRNDYVFRSEIASRLLNSPEGSIVTACSIAALLTHPEGIIKGSPSRARVIPVINKMDLAGAPLKGRILAGVILKAGHPAIKRVILAQVRCREPVVETVKVDERLADR